MSTAISDEVKSSAGSVHSSGIPVHITNRLGMNNRRPIKYTRNCSNLIKIPLIASHSLFYNSVETLFG